MARGPDFILEVMHEGSRARRLIRSARSSDPLRAVPRARRGLPGAGYAAVAIAAHDKRINDGTWRRLEPGRKELLLPVGDEKLMRKAATHVMKRKLSLQLTRR